MSSTRGAGNLLSSGLFSPRLEEPARAPACRQDWRPHVYTHGCIQWRLKPTAFRAGNGSDFDWSVDRPGRISGVDQADIRLFVWNQRDGSDDIRVGDLITCWRSAGGLLHSGSSRNEGGPDGRTQVRMNHLSLVICHLFSDFLFCQSIALLPGGLGSQGK